MRLSVYSDDPGYRAWRKLWPRVAITVRVDGKPVEHCFVADTKRGYALVGETDPTGAVRLNARRNDVLKKQLHGRVEIDFGRR